MKNRMIGWFKRRIRPSLCKDCKIKIDRKLSIKSKMDHKVRHIKRARHVKHKLKAGVHKVRIRGKLRRVKVLANGQWRFMK